MKNTKILVKTGVVLKTPVTIELQPGESFTVYYNVAPTFHIDTKI
jgi:hypothetical protein